MNRNILLKNVFSAAGQTVVQTVVLFLLYRYLIDRLGIERLGIWGVVLAMLSEHTGYTVDELHAWAKAKFLPKQMAIAGANGEIVDEYVVGGSTTKLNKLQFSEYVEQIRRFAAEHLDVVIPDPDRERRHANR